MRTAISTRAIERLLEAERFAEAERVVAQAAPQLQTGSCRRARRGRLVRRAASRQRR